MATPVVGIALKSEEYSAASYRIGISILKVEILPYPSQKNAYSTGK
ncbi:MAG: hypothetical protein RMZ43_001330 [Nostoc sp. CmiVER01]